MNPFYLSILTAFIRTVLIWIAGRLGIQSDAAEIGSAALTIATFLWSIYEKFREQQKLVTVQAVAGMSHEDVRRVVDAGNVPSVRTRKDVVPQ